MILPLWDWVNWAKTEVVKLRQKWGRVALGAGGFIDITQNAKKVVFLGTFTARGAEYKFDNGKLNIVKEGKIRKMVKQVASFLLMDLWQERRGRK